MARRIEQDDPLVTAGLVLRLRRPEGGQLPLGLGQIGHAEVEVQLLVVARPGGPAELGRPLEAEALRTVRRADVDEVVARVERLPAGEPGVEGGERLRVRGVERDGGELSDGGHKEVLSTAWRCHLSRRAEAGASLVGAGWKGRRNGTGGARAARHAHAAPYPRFPPSAPHQRPRRRHHGLAPPRPLHVPARRTLGRAALRRPEGGAAQGQQDQEVAQGLRRERARHGARALGRRDARRLVALRRHHDLGDGRLGAFEPAPGREADRRRVRLVVVEQAPRVAGQVLRVERDGLDQLRDDTAVHRVEEVHLAAEVPVEQGVVHPGHRGDAVDPRPGDAVAGELLGGRGEDLATGLLRIARHGTSLPRP
ncbi:putative transcriptional regulator, TetR family protein [Streptomyces sp. Tu6071]|nr:putative transcriptional regulator, TetR family protein [Streptomyces sp. Tu6071]